MKSSARAIQTIRQFLTHDCSASTGKQLLFVSSTQYTHTIFIISSRKCRSVYPRAADTDRLLAMLCIPSFMSVRWMVFGTKHSEFAVIYRTSCVFVIATNEPKCHRIHDRLCFTCGHRHRHPAYTQPRCQLLKQIGNVYIRYGLLILLSLFGEFFPLFLCPFHSRFRDITIRVGKLPPLLGRLIYTKTNWLHRDKTFYHR